MRRAAESIPTQEGLHRLNNLYAVDLFLSGEHTVQAVEEYTLHQEKTHIAEGLKLMQRSVRTLPFKDGHTRGFGDEPMVNVNQQGYRAAQKQYLAGDTDARGLAQRRSHDVSIAEQGDALMLRGEVGDGFMVVTPYAEEWDDKTAQRLGFWPEYRRSYVWFYRKKSEFELECVDVSVDRSSLKAYGALLVTKGVDIPADAKSHDIPGYSIYFKAKNAAERDEVIDEVLNTYKQLNNDPQAMSASNAFEAVEFLDAHAAEYLKLVVAVHKSVAQSLAGGSLTDLVRLSANRALHTLNCLDADDIQELHDLLGADKISKEHRNAFAVLLTAQRYGVWEAVSKLAANPVAVPGRRYEQAAMNQSYNYSHTMGTAIQTALMLDHIFGNVNDAAEQGKTMPGCAGGTSFLKQDEASTKSLIFSKDKFIKELLGTNEEEKYAFDQKEYCVECQAPPSPGEDKKMCGPCKMCRPCDIKKRAENGSQPLAD